MNYGICSCGDVKLSIFMNITMTLMHFLFAYYVSLCVKQLRMTILILNYIKIYDKNIPDVCVSRLFKINIQLNNSFFYLLLFI